MKLTVDFLALGAALLLPFASAQQADPALVGTWTTKSRKVITGPGFYDPVNDKFTEPQLTGISYSFTADGHYEVAYYRAISNPANPNCAQGIMQWQHGSYTKNANGSLSLEPIAVDGRQLLSSPCEFQNSVFTRYHQPELIKSYRIETDSYNKMKRLNLFQYDGAPQNPMWIAYSPPQMLPTETLNPTAATGTGSAKSTSKAKSKRSLDENSEPLKWNLSSKEEPWLLRNADVVWWTAVGMTAIGGVAKFCL